MKSAPRSPLCCVYVRQAIAKDADISGFYYRKELYFSERRRAMHAAGFAQEASNMSHTVSDAPFALQITLIAFCGRQVCEEYARTRQRGDCT